MSATPCLESASRWSGPALARMKTEAQLLLVARKARPDLTQIADRVDVGDDRVMARALEPLIMEAAVPALADHRWRRYGDGAVGFPRLQPGEYLRYVPDRALRQVSHLGTRIGQDLLARAVIELLRDLQGLGGRPAEPGTAKLLQRRQIVKPGRALPLVLGPARRADPRSPAPRLRPFLRSRA